MPILHLKRSAWPPPLELGQLREETKGGAPSDAEFDQTLDKIGTTCASFSGNFWSYWLHFGKKRGTTTGENAPANLVQNPSENHKICSQGSPRAPQISPGTLPRHLEAQKIHKFTKRAPKSRESRPKGPSGRGPKSLKNPSWRQGEIFWGPRDLKKSQKNES